MPSIDEGRYPSGWTTRRESWPPGPRLSRLSRTARPQAEPGDSASRTAARQGRPVRVPWPRADARPRRAPGGVRRAVMPGAREQLQQEDREDDVARSVAVAARTRP